MPKPCIADPAYNMIIDWSPNIANKTPPIHETKQLVNMMEIGLKKIAVNMLTNLMAAKHPQNVAVICEPVVLDNFSKLLTENVARYVLNRTSDPL